MKYGDRVMARGHAGHACVGEVVSVIDRSAGVNTIGVKWPCREETDYFTGDEEIQTLQVVESAEKPEHVNVEGPEPEFDAGAKAWHLLTIFGSVERAIQVLREGTAALEPLGIIRVNDYRKVREVIGALQDLGKVEARLRAQVEFGLAVARQAVGDRSPAAMVLRAINGNEGADASAGTLTTERAREYEFQRGMVRLLTEDLGKTDAPRK